ncbi:hypothetical protein P278_09900 [Zhouia amylolytica AD3]|uniref:Uncharacterized protein n=1 Tax=Zhouia amylolytica AD3 TaxID=1286632 RepID=W2UMR0_9FLAO|nr:hypothetical protein P278_09900 [Zhouia amylolytica AD3]
MSHDNIEIPSNQSDQASESDKTVIINAHHDFINQKNVKF